MLPESGGVQIEQSTDHLLILGVVPPRLSLEKINRRLAQADGDFYRVLLQCELVGWRQEILHQIHLQRLIRVFDFAFHIVFSLAANIRLR